MSEHDENRTPPRNRAHRAVMSRRDRTHAGLKLIDFLDRGWSRPGVAALTAAACSFIMFVAFSAERWEQVAAALTTVAVLVCAQMTGPCWGVATALCLGCARVLLGDQSDELFALLPIWALSAGATGSLGDARREMLAGVRAANASAHDARERQYQAQARYELLQELSGSLAGATTARQIANVQLTHALRAIDADAAAIGVLDDNDDIRVLATFGFPEDLVSAGSPINLTRDTPAAATVRDGKSRWYTSAEQIRAEYRSPWILELLTRTQYQEWVFIPIRIGERIVGELTLARRTPRTNPDVDRELLHALVRQCAQAIERAQLYDW